VVVGNGYIYWANDFNIGRARLNGTDVNQNFIAVPDGPSGVSALAVTSRHIYWTDETAGNIGRANLDGTDVNQTFITGASFPQVGLVVGCRHIYWTNADSGTVGRANLNGSGVNQNFIAATNNDLTGLAIDPGR
jgi:virginiamycin B lyase